MLTVLKNSENRFYTSYVNAIDSFLYGLFDKEDDANMNTMNFMMKQLDDIIQNLFLMFRAYNKIPFPASTPSFIE